MTPKSLNRKPLAWHPVVVLWRCQNADCRHEFATEPLSAEDYHKCPWRWCPKCAASSCVIGVRMAEFSWTAPAWVDTDCDCYMDTGLQTTLVNSSSDVVGWWPDMFDAEEDQKDL